MLSINTITQSKLANGSIQTIKYIIVKHNDIPRQILYVFHIYVIIEFKYTTNDEESKWRSDLPRTRTPIVPVTNFRKNVVL